MLVVECLSQVPKPPEVSARDACSEVTIGFNETVSGPPCDQIITRTWTAIDACGNSASCQQIIKVHDSTPPSLTAGDIAGCYKTQAEAEAAAIAATGSSDACGGPVKLSASMIRTSSRGANSPLMMVWGMERAPVASHVLRCLMCWATLLPECQHITEKRRAGSRRGALLLRSPAPRQAVAPAPTFWSGSTAAARIVGSARPVIRARTVRTGTFINGATGNTSSGMSARPSHRPCRAMVGTGVSRA